jgi:glycosyltransferase involved in cell wall biosynthesis
MTQSNLPVSAVIFTKNESRNIAECIASLSAFNEILVVDSGSSDGTQKIARDLGANVINFEWNGLYPKKRQWSLQSLSYANPWILFVDADERVTSNLVLELQEFMHLYSSKFSAASIPIDYYFAGKKLSFGQKPRKIVLLRLGKASFPEIDDLGADGMGELEGHYQPAVNGRIKKFTNAISHNDSDPISSWMIRHINYAKWEAHLLLNHSAKSEVERLKGPTAAALHKLPFRPLSFFIYSYIFKFGFLDGKAGFDYAFAKSWYYWLSDVIARERTHHGK